MNKKIQLSLGIRYLNNNNFEKAEEIFLDIIEEDEENPIANNCLAMTLILIGHKLELASNCLKIALQSNLSSKEYNKNIFLCLKRMTEKGAYEEQKKLYEWWRFQTPTNPFLRHFENIINKNHRKTPLDFIRINKEFLASGVIVDYDISEYNIFPIVKTYIEEKFKKSDNENDFLELNCSKGEFSNILKPYTKLGSLTGVDVSKELIEKALLKNNYTDLIQSESKLFLRNTTKTYDFICAIEAFDYEGDLLEILGLIKSRLNKNGSLFFVVESKASYGDYGYDMNLNGKYAYNSKYINMVLQEAGFKNINIESTSYFKKKENEVYSFLVEACV